MPAKERKPRILYFAIGVLILFVLALLLLAAIGRTDRRTEDTIKPFLPLRDAIVNDAGQKGVKIALSYSETDDARYEALKRFSDELDIVYNCAVHEKYELSSDFDWNWFYRLKRNEFSYVVCDSQSNIHQKLVDRGYPEIYRDQQSVVLKRPEIPWDAAEIFRILQDRNAPMAKTAVLRGDDYSEPFWMFYLLCDDDEALDMFDCQAYRDGETLTDDWESITTNGVFSYVVARKDTDLYSNFADKGCETLYSGEQYVLFELPYILIDNRNALFDSDKGFVLSGRSSSKEIKITINDSYYGAEASGDGEFVIRFDGSEFESGWNTVCLSIPSEGQRTLVSNGGAIHILDTGPDVFVPKADLFSARIYGNARFCKEYDYAGESDYLWNGPYLSMRPVKESNARQFDDSGIPTTFNGDSYYYNPVAIIQHGLGLYNSYTAKPTDNTLSDLLKTADWLVEHQNEDGSYSYDSSFALKENMILPEGFVSGMAQGQALSLFARTYDLTKDSRYLEAGAHALQFMLRSGEEDNTDGCMKTLSDFCLDNGELRQYGELRLYEEYVTTPSSYVLNGDLFALLGLYDWSQCASDPYGKKEASEAFREGIQAVEILLPYYDYYGWSAYDLLQYTFDSTPYFTSSYAHHFHIRLLGILSQLSGSDVFQYYRDVFEQYNTDPFWRQIEQMYYDPDAPAQS